MQAIRSIIYRIRWRSVIALLLLVACAYILLANMPSGYNVGGGIGLWAQAKPDTIKPGATSYVLVELKNLQAKEGMVVSITGLTYDENLIFDDTYAQTYSGQPITIGPEELRKLSFKIRARDGILPGEYRVLIRAEQAGKPGTAEKSVTVNVDAKAST